MTKKLMVAVCFAGFLLEAQAQAQSPSTGPDQRVLTDPSAVVSVANQNATPVPYDDLYFTRSVSNAAWSPNGKTLLFTTDLSGRANLWKVSAAGGWPVQLVQSDERQIGGTWSPDGRWIVYQQDFGGNELWHVFAVPSAGGSAIDLTHTPDVREEAPRWSPDGKTIALNYKTKDGAAYDLALMDWTSRKVSTLTHGGDPNYSWQSVAWSRDGKTLYANREEVSYTDADIYAVDVASGKTTNLTPHQGKVLNLGSALSPDGKTLLITSNLKGGYPNVALLDIATRKLNWVTDTQWEASAGDFSPKGTSFTYTLNADGVTDTYLADVATLKRTRIPLDAGLNLPAAYPSAYSPDGDRLLLSHESPLQPADLWVYDIKAGNAKQITQSAIASLSTAAIPQMQIVHYKAFDGKTISALLWMPFNLKRDGSNPALVLPHGGPTEQSQAAWNPEVAALVSRGYICIAPNVRGSTGYGMDFQHINFKDLGGADLQDEVYAVKFLERTGYVNAKKVGITGGSYGGFMTLMAIGKTPDIWTAAVDEYGIIDWMTMLQHSDPQLQQYIKTMVGDPVTDLAAYQASSPKSFLHNEHAPLLVLQGDNDPRVPKEESVQLVDLLKADGKTVDAHYYPDEGHGFAKRENQIDATRRTVAWFDQYLKGAP